MASEPLSALLPDHAPSAEQALALVVDHDSRVPAPALTVLGSAIKVICGARGATVTVTAWVAEPPAPMQTNSYSVVLLSAPVDHEPLVARPPLQPPDAAHAAAFFEVHSSVELPPIDTVEGVAVRVTSGAAEVTTTSADCDAEPAGPVQVNV